MIHDSILSSRLARLALGGFVLAVGAIACADTEADDDADGASASVEDAYRCRTRRCRPSGDAGTSTPAPTTTTTAPAPTPTTAPTTPPTAPPTTSGGWPLGWNDPVFANVKPRGISSFGFSGVTEDISIDTTSGDPMVGCQNFTVRRFRGRGREGIRICGDNVLVEDFYLEVAGTGDDHADGIQAYGEYGMSNVVFRRGNIVVGGASNAGIFLADNSNVDLTLEHIRVDAAGAPNGALFFANVPNDRGCNSLTLRDVLVNPKIRFEGIANGGCTIKAWENVRYFDGTPIPRP